MYGYHTASSNQIIVNDVLAHVDQGGWGPYGWYVGIATDVRQRLFGDHRVEEQSFWIYRQAGSESEARATEKELLSARNFKGAPGGGYNPRYVYAYKITSTTVE